MCGKTSLLYRSEPPTAVVGLRVGFSGTQRPLDPGQPEDRVHGHHDTRNGALCGLAAVRSSPFRVLTLRSRTVRHNVPVRLRSGRWECCSAASCPDRTPRSLLLSAALFDATCTAARFPSTCRRVDARHRQGHHCACYIERIRPNLVSYRPASSIPQGPHAGTCLPASNNGALPALISLLVGCAEDARSLHDASECIAATASNAQTRRCERSRCRNSAVLYCMFRETAGRPVLQHSAVES